MPKTVDKYTRRLANLYLANITDGEPTPEKLLFAQQLWNVMDGPTRRLAASIHTDMFRRYVDKNEEIEGNA